MARRPPKQPATPTDATLHDAALAHLARYASTRAGLIRVLDRKVARWGASELGNSEGVNSGREAARRVVARLVESGAVSDAAFAEVRARSLHRAGKSSRAIGAHLATRGVAVGMATQAARQEPAQELAAALIHVRRRRLGAYRATAGTADDFRRALASLARAGFGGSVAIQALRATREEAEALITEFRSAL
jgi:regulatory protein